MPYQGKRVLITGGLGFIGSNLAVRLVRQGARVVVVDSCVEGCGSNLFNLDEVAGHLTVVTRPISEIDRGHILGADVVFNLAGEISHIHSMLSPERDLQLNSVEQLTFLKACQRDMPGVRVVYAGTRQVYGKPKYLPVDESHPVCPVDFNGVHKHAAESYHLLLTESGGVDAIVLRLTNVYGPRMALNMPCQGFLGAFVRRALLGEDLIVFGDGLQLRDPLYVDDAVNAFLAAGFVERPLSRLYNVGGPEPLGVREISELTSAAGGRSNAFLRPFPEHLRGIDIGSYWTDCRRIGDELGWRPAVCFREGIRRTIEYFEPILPHYLPGMHSPACSLPIHEARSDRHVRLATA